MALVPGSTNEGTWSDPSVPANIGPGTHASADEPAELHILDVNYRPFTGTYTVRCKAYHISGIDHLGAIQDNGTEETNGTPILGFNPAAHTNSRGIAIPAMRQSVQDRLEYLYFEFEIDSTALSGYSGGKRLTKIWVNTYAVDGTNVQKSIIYEANTSSDFPTETKYVALTTNSPSNSNDGSSAHPWASLGYALDNIADGGEIVLVDGGTESSRAVYTDENSSRSLRSNTRFITISTPNDRKTVEVVGIRNILLLHMEGYTNNCSAGQLVPVSGGGSTYWLDNVWWTSRGRQYDTIGPTQFNPVTLDYQDYTFYCEDSDAYDCVTGFQANGLMLVNCTATLIAGIPFGGGAGGVVFNFYCDEFTTAWTVPANNADGIGPDPTPIGGSEGAYTSTLASGMNDSQTTCSVASARGSSNTGLPGDAGGPAESYPYYLAIDSEKIKVTGRSGTTLTIVRAQRGTSAASHSDGATVISIDATYHPDIWHSFGPVDDKMVYGLRFGPTVSGTVARIERGAITNLVFVNVDATELPSSNEDGTELNNGGVSSDFSNEWENVVFDNVAMPQNYMIFTADVGETPDLPFAATKVYFIDTGVHFRNADFTADHTASGVTFSGNYIPEDGISSRAITGFTAISGTSGVAHSWNPNTWADIDNLYLEKSTDNGSNWTQIASLLTSATTAGDTSVSDGVDYLYRLKSYDVSSGAEVYSVVAAITYSVGDARPDQPANVTATPASGQITLAWSDQIVDGFRVYAGNGTTVLYDDTATSFAVTGLTDGVTNTFYVAAYNANGESTRKRVVATAGGDVPIRTGLTALFDANAGSGSTIADSVGSNDLTVVNGATWAGAPTYTRTGLLSDAADEGARIAAPDIALKPTGDFTFFWWGRFLGNPTVSSHISGIVYDTSSNPPYTPYSFLHNSGAGVVPAAGYNTGGGFALHNMPGTFSAGTDYVLCMRVEGGVITLGASNGSALTDTPDTWASAYAASSNFAVAVYNALSRNANLITYLTSVSNRALSDDEIADVLADPTLLENPPTLNAPSVTVDSHDETSITVSWTPGSGGSGSNTFDAYKRVSGVGSYVLVEAGVTSPYQYTGLSAGTSYDLKITQSDDDPVTPQTASTSVTQATDAAAASGGSVGGSSLSVLMVLGLLK